MRALIALCVAVAAVSASSEFSMESDTMDIPFNKILGIKQMADESYLDSPQPSGGNDVKLLGDSDAMAEVESQASEDARDEGLLIRADSLLRKMAAMRKERALKSVALGESLEDTEGANAAFPKILARNPTDVSNTVNNVVSYLGNMIKDGQVLTEDQIHQARKWYLQTTAVVLGRYAYEAQQAKIDKSGEAGFDALQSRAEAAKQSMDKIDAAEHLRKMGAENWMDHSGTNILELMSKTGHLANFLSEIEAATRNHKKSYVGESSDVKKLQAREAEITKAVNQLLARVEAGDPITGSATQEQTPANPADSAREKKLMGKLMVAADKEDKARIVEAAGEVAEKQISSVMKAAQKNIDENEAKVVEEDKEAKQEREEEREEEIEDERDEAEGIHVVHDAQPMIMTRNDLAVPMSTLHEHVTTTVNKHLDHILQLFKERKESHEKMSLADYKNVNSVLRGLAAHLMQKYADQSEEKPFALKVPLAKALTMPLAQAAWMRKQSDIDAEQTRNAEYVKKHHAHPLNEALTVPLSQAKEMMKQSGADKPADTQSTNDDGVSTAVGTSEDGKPADNAFGNPFGPAGVPTTKATEDKPQEEAPAEAAKEPQENQAEAAAPAPAAAAGERDPVTQFVWSTLGKGGINRINKASNLQDLLKGGVKMPSGAGFLRFVCPQE